MVTVLEGEAQGLGEPLVRTLPEKEGLPLGEAVSRTEAVREGEAEAVAAREPEAAGEAEAEAEAVEVKERRTVGLGEGAKEGVAATVRVMEADEVTVVVGV